MNSWEEVRQEIAERLDNPSKEDIALYIEKAYRLGYAKGVNVAAETLVDLKYELQIGAMKAKEQVERINNELKSKGKKRRT